MTKELYYQQILKLISEGKIVSALDLVEHCAKEFNIDELLVFAILNKARLARAKEEDGIGVLDGASYNIELNRINKAIVDSINVLKEEPSAFPIGDQVRYGRIAHNIPPTMSRGIAKICKVRIAKLDELLYDKNFPQTAASTPESLEITERMEVELYDPSGGEAFSVEVVNREVILNCNRFCAFDSINHLLFAQNLMQRSISTKVNEVVYYKKRNLGINMSYTKLANVLNNITIKDQNNDGQLETGESVAIHVEGGGYLKYESRTHGINLVWSTTPVYEWAISENNKAILPVTSSKKYALYNYKIKKYLIYGERKGDMINLVWQQEY